MRLHLLLALWLISFLSFGQNEGMLEDDLAADYLKRGEFKKAALAYQKLYDTKKNIGYLFKIVEAQQQLGEYNQAETLLLERLKQSVYPPLLVALGYNYQLKNNLKKANEAYSQALLKVEENPVFVTAVARQFETHSLLQQAIKAYTIGLNSNTGQYYHFALARIYGELGDVPQMFAHYLNQIEEKPDYLNQVKRMLGEFISENKEHENNRYLRQLLLKKLQLQPEPLWYQLLSWFYIQEKDFNKAFVQEKALYKRNPISINNILQLGLMAQSEKQLETAKSIFQYIIDTSQDITSILTAHHYLLKLETSTTSPKNYAHIQKQYQALFNQYGLSVQTLNLQLDYGNFMAFYLHQPKVASAFLKQSLKLNLSKFQEATVKLLLGDILVYQERFNEALIYYTQIQANLKNSTLAQEARFKVAKTSYYKGDFNWAESQLKILKSSTSQLIANDALDLKLLITDNKFEDSLQVALKLYSKADLMAFQNKDENAISLLDQILLEHQGESITDQALLKQAQLFEKNQQYQKAAHNYQKIITNYNDGILADDAYYYLAELYNYHLAAPEKAKTLYEQIIFNYQDSIFVVEARKKFRMLRGDTIN